MPLENLCFLGFKKVGSKSVFVDFGVLFGVIFGALGRTKKGELTFRVHFSVWRVPGVVLGALFESFGGHLWCHF